jgi:PmbA protein
MPDTSPGNTAADPKMTAREELAAAVVRLARKEGASAIEVAIREGTEFVTSVRLGAVEKLLQANFRKLGIRIFHGSCSAIASTSDFAPVALLRFVSDTLAMARAAGADPAAALPGEDLYQRSLPSLPLYYPRASTLPASAKIDLAIRCEDAALKFDARINNSEGAGFSDSVIFTTYANSYGVSRSYSKSLATLHAIPLAEANGQKQRDYWLSTHLDFDQLQSPEIIGAEAARRTLLRLGARKVATCEVPVIFDPLAAATLLKHLSEAASGLALQRKASFLLDMRGKQIASSLVTILDDATLPGGVGSRPFDAEGVPSQTTCVVREGILENYLLDDYSARKLGLTSTGNSNRELHAAPSAGPSNFYLKSGRQTPEEIVGSLREGLLVTELIGFGVDIVSGNYSRGASGLWIQNGIPVFPVEEITIAGNLKDMLTKIEAVGNDPVSLGEIFSPTVLIGKMVVSGS